MLYVWLLISLILVGGGTERALKGRKEWWRVAWWGAAMLPMLLLMATPAMYPKDSPQRTGLIVAFLTFGLAWAVYGVSQVLPVMLRDVRERGWWKA